MSFHPLSLFILHRKTILVSGGLGRNNFQDVITSSSNEPEGGARNPIGFETNLPEKRFMHCLVNINDSFLFLHGGRKPVNASGIYGPNYIRHVFHLFSYLFTHPFPFIANETETNSYILDRTQLKWIKA